MKNRKCHWLIVACYLLGMLVISKEVLAQPNALPESAMGMPSSSATAGKNKQALLKISVTTLANSLLANTKILVDQKQVCEVGVSTDCEIRFDIGSHEITLNNASDFGNFSDKYDLEAGKIYQFEVITDWTTVGLNSLIPFIPLGTIFSAKGKDSQIKLQLISVQSSAEN